MDGQSSAMVGCSWTEVSVLRSQVFGQPLKESCVVLVCKSKLIFIDCKALLAKTKTYKAYSK